MFSIFHLRKKSKDLVNRSIIFLFLFICFLHLFTLRPLWLDEQFVLDNIQKSSYRQILGPLSLAQAFPRIYLILIKWLSQPFQHHRLLLRIIPFISMLCAFGLWKKIYEKVSQSDGLYLLALFFFCCSYRMSYYAFEFKPYSMDVLVSGLFCWFIIHQKEWGRSPSSFKKSLFLYLLPITLLFSYASIFFVWIVPYNFVFLAQQNKKIWRTIIYYCLLLSLCLIFIFYFDIRHSLAEKGLTGYWEPYFVCTESFSCFAETVWEGFRRLATWWFGQEKFFIRAASFLIPFFLFGLFRYGLLSWKKESFRIFKIEPLFGVLLLELFFLGILKKYPFTGERITLFLAPFIYFIMAKSFQALKSVKWLYYLFMLSLICLLLGCYVSSIIYYCKLYTLT